MIINEELDALSGSRRQRKRYVKSADGRSGRKAAKHILEAARDLAGDIAHAQGQDTDEVEFSRAEITRLRGKAAA